MTTTIEKLLEHRIVWLVARLLLSVVFVAGGVAKLVDFDGGVAEMQAAGLTPAVLYNIAVAATLLAGAALIVLDRALWLGAGALAVFLVLTIVVVHRFWALPQPQAQLALFFALEHVSLIGGLMAAAVASHARRMLIHPMVTTLRNGIQQAHFHKMM